MYIDTELIYTSEGCSTYNVLWHRANYKWQADVANACLHDSVLATLDGRLTYFVTHTSWLLSSQFPDTTIMQTIYTILKIVYTDIKTIV